jgi:hypothetical protein
MWNIFAVAAQVLKWNTCAAAAQDEYLCCSCSSEILERMTNCCSAAAEMEER